jgi:putative phage-type endonuclease
MEQRSDEWFAARKGRVTGSVVGAILGLSPHMTREDVMRSMVREYHGADSEFSGNVATQWGTFHETGAIQDFQMETGMKVVPCGFFTHVDWLGASPDGLVGDDALIEVKCPFSKRDGGEFKSIDEQPHYHAQMQIQMFVTERSMTYFWQWAPHGHMLEVVKRDDGWLDDNIPVLFAFYEEYLKEREEPEEYLAPKRVEVNTNRAFHLIAEYDELQEAIDRATERKKELMDEMIALAKDRNALIAGRKLTKVTRQGAVSYANVVKKHCKDVDLEPFRGKSSTGWRLT